MKFRLLCATALCICVGQVCSTSNAINERKIKIIKENLQNKIHGVGKQFVDDITTILDHSPSNTYFIEIIGGTSLVNVLGEISTEHNGSFSVDYVSFFEPPSYMNKSETKPDYHESIQKLDYYKTLQSTFSKQFPPERYNGIMNMFYIKINPNATSEEIANTLHYLDGTDDAATKVSYLDLHDFPEPVASDCPRESQEYSKAVDKLKSMIDIKPKVFEDFVAIQEKFPCNSLASRWLKDLVDVFGKLHGDESKINACMILEGNHTTGADPNDEFEFYYSTLLEPILSTRLPDETFRGQLNFIKTQVPNTPKDEIEKALEYLYDDVPKGDCSSLSKAQN